jgi:hypothetical protein
MSYEVSRVVANTTYCDLGWTSGKFSKGVRNREILSPNAYGPRSFHDETKIASIVAMEGTRSHGAGNLLLDIAGAGHERN